MYAKLNDSKSPVFFTGRVLRVGGRTVSNPTEATLREAGYKPVFVPDAPATERGQTLAIDYEDRGDRIECVYTVLDGLKA